MKAFGIVTSLAALAMMGCGGSGSDGPGAGGAAGAGAGGAGGSAGGAGGAAGGASGAAGPSCANIDYAAYAAMPAVSFKNDVMPILAFSCTVSSACHGVSSHKANLNLGYRCTYDKTVKWTCTYPTTPTYIDGSTTDIDTTAPQPYDPAIASMVRTGLLAPATTVNGGTVQRVAPMHPESSFIIEKLTDTQNSKGYTCTNQDPAYAPLDSCGVFMPLNGNKWCESSERPRFDALATWIAQGALDN
jgi:hypothetical protein